MEPVGQDGAIREHAPSSLTPKEAFYNKLSDISEDGYAHTQTVWETYRCSELRDCHDLYNWYGTDILLLSDVFVALRKTCMWQYGLEPAHYYTSPSLPWDALLKKTGVELELLTFYNQHLIIEKRMRGGISMVSTRLARSKNPRV